MQQVETIGQQFEQCFVFLYPAVDYRDQHRFHFVGEIADCAQFGHARAALERMQVALQLHDRGKILAARIVALLLRPAVQRVVTHFEQFVGFVDEYRQQLVVALLLGGLVQHRHRVDEIAVGFLVVGNFDRVLLEILGERGKAGPEIGGDGRQRALCDQIGGHALDRALALAVERDDFLVQPHGLRRGELERLFHQAGEFADSRDIGGARGAVDRV